MDPLKYPKVNLHNPFPFNPLNYRKLCVTHMCRLTLPQDPEGQFLAPEVQRKITGEMFGNLIKSYYLYIMNTTPIIKKRINHDSMWISCKFPSGANFKYRITRYDSRLEFAFSNDDDEAKVQIKTFNEWLKKNHTTSYGDLFNKLENLCKVCNTGKELITKMK